ncbi:MAG: DMP19 family protein [Bacteroidales bacterium]|nr:DMP19 family protein [Bacteroidaceae bacterium]MDO4186030.1 DMP19 family protein [Bacteroidales bacterium]MBQ9883492.1 DMP19 family protein [Bacteroidaceae bacterium]MBR2161145.1 DMP19 family protein [Bacteroidaceae bacterium]MBR3014348.1 DMP19 family protein [Bacteroidaceae bacterium]
MIKISDATLRDAAAKGMDAFIDAFADAYLKETGGEWTAEKMALLNADQHTLLAYKIFKDEVTEGGLLQLIQNGYGSYIFHNPFAKALKSWGIADLAKMLYRARELYDLCKDDLERERSDEEFMALYEQYEELNDLDDAFIENEELYTAQVADYIDNHIENFAEIETLD